MTDDAGSRSRRRRIPWRRTGLLAIVVGTALLTAACGGGASGSPRVASLGNTGGDAGSTSPGSPTGGGNATDLLDKWAVCIRGHGDPNQVDPTIDSNNDIQISMTNVSATLSHAVHGSTGPCSNYLLAAESALRGSHPAPTDNPVAEVKFADCMRANGVPSWPDPSADGDTNFNGTGVDPNSQAVQNTMKLCDAKTGERYYAPGTEAPGVVIVTSCNAPAGRQCSSGGPPGGGGPVEVPSSDAGPGANG